MLSLAARSRIEEKYAHVRVGYVTGGGQGGGGAVDKLRKFLPGSRSERIFFYQDHFFECDSHFKTYVFLD